MSSADPAPLSRDERRGDRQFFVALGGLLAAALVWRFGYLWLRAAGDPSFGRPMFDGDYYLEWARALAGGGAGPQGAYYLAPLYPYALALFLAVFGERWFLLYLFQLLLSLAGVGTIALAARGPIGRLPALAAAALLLLYHPLVFFAARPMGETLALFLLFAALAAFWRPSPSGAALAGLCAGLAALARPNLLLVPMVWVVGQLLERRWRRAGLLVAGVALVLLPVTLRNLTVSGHPVVISSNGGLTLYHGNGPGARGVYTPPRGFSGDPREQRAEATAMARAQSGRQLDDVEADGWWGRQAIAERLRDPAGSLVLLAQRGLLLVDSRELGLDYHPMLDTNGLRPVLRLGSAGSWPLVPFGLLLGLAVAGVLLGGVRASGGWPVWGAIAACAATPLLFYVSSRYRLPTAAVLALPAGFGLVALFRRPAAGAKRRLALAAAAACLVLSVAVPAGEMHRAFEAQGLTDRALAWKAAGDLQSAWKDATRARELAPRSARVRFNLGVVAAARGELAVAEQAYREAVELEPPGRAEAAANLSSLMIRRGEPASALPFLRRALLEHPSNALCWNNLVVALYDSGDPMAALRAVGDASRNGVTVDPALVRHVQGQRVPAGDGDSSNPDP